MDKPTILYVDDESINLDLFRLNFNRDYNVFTAISGIVGLDIVKQNKVDLVITDYKMPLMNGIEFIKQIKNGFPRLNCVIVSGYVEADVLTPDEKAIVFDFITKPWLKANLLGVMQRALVQ